eukprot:CAMPEP_0182416648 /NCGR_PEP_ID=MMETSP1167-20130531/1019_1 /TAXON_ID=2988 /ORGANISM="Mallomonas Sp, Strain CCMP3275" /LENGTH=126 /DNA_ID=CAMNT_0024589619 /DNA_START=162 /DNA_END=542 /DNA_ORIENTATION=+
MSTQLKMIELEANTATYVGMFVATMIPSLVLVKFIGDSADKSRDSISDEQKEKFKKAMMETQGVNLGAISTEEDAIKKRIAQAYMQDKDVDVAVLEQKLRDRAKWRRELQEETKNAGQGGEDEDGW